MRIDATSAFSHVYPKHELTRPHARTAQIAATAAETLTATPVESPVEPPLDTPVEPTAETPVDPTTEVPTTTTPEVPTDPTAEVPSDPTAEVPVDSPIEPTEPATPQRKRGVIRLLEAGHFKGVADVRLRINFFDELAAGGVAQPPVADAPAGKGKAYDKFLALYQEMSKPVESPVETPTEPAVEESA